MVEQNAHNVLVASSNLARSTTLKTKESAMWLLFVFFSGNLYIVDVENGEKCRLAKEEIIQAEESASVVCVEAYQRFDGYNEG